MLLRWAPRVGSSRPSTRFRRPTKVNARMRKRPPEESEQFFRDLLNSMSLETPKRMKIGEADPPPPSTSPELEGAQDHRLEGIQAQGGRTRLSTHRESLTAMLNHEGYPVGDGGGTPALQMEALESVMRISMSEDSQQARYMDSRYFRDGLRQIDFVIAYADDGSEEEEEVKKRAKRESFETNLMEVGLELELEDKKEDVETYFLKVHAPSSVLTRYSEILNMRTCIKAEEQERRKKSFYRRLTTPFDYDHSLISSAPENFSTGFQSSKEDQLMDKNRDTNFSNAERTYIVYELLRRAHYADDDEKFGIQRLISNGTYEAGFPLHDGGYDREPPKGTLSTRRLLYQEWARPLCWYKRQPLWLVRKYFGDQIGLYFTWLGFYTKMLIPAAIVGVICFLFGIISLQDNIPSRDICDENGPGNFTMCPLCDKACRHWKLKDSCTFSKFTFLFDNPATVFFSIFMAFWATMFLELWKRKQSIVAWEWDLDGFEEEEDARPEYEVKVKTTRLNPVTGQDEPYLTRLQKVLRIFTVSSFVLFLLFLVIGAVFGVIVYRITMIAVLNSSTVAVFKANAKLVASITTAVMSLFVIQILNCGRFYGYPGNTGARKSFSYDLCDPAGCLFELCIQLCIIMVGKQALNNFKELALPTVMNWWRRRMRSSRATVEDPAPNEKEEAPQWEQDHTLSSVSQMALFEEYLEMVIQFGFVTLFVAAFPLAPLFALLNNIVELRLDAYKFVCQVRRPLPKRVQDIGAWFGILKAVTYVAVTCNAFVIAYTTDFIPRMVYEYSYSSDETLRGYINSSLSVFDTTNPNFTKEFLAEEDKNLSTTCRYPGYRNPPNDPDGAYEPSLMHWHIFAARLAFVVIFEHIVFALTEIMAYIIPDIPEAVKVQMQRERFLARQALFDTEKKKIQAEKKEKYMGMPPPGGSSPVDAVPALRLAHPRPSRGGGQARSLPHRIHRDSDASSSTRGN
ncbi:unnamed protein product [Darwinula stevensoni]|uniref:Anoctamin n=1 Tax=Darwinula stevensoni TaxID=69355 RepID=A0A7R8X584_9CRUS|nr:unnamed protein product [Darwinula stevensoni]CAG0886851.1 unnamed protein product [Darwinula stevensoni]